MVIPIKETNAKVNNLPNNFVKNIKQTFCIKSQKDYFLKHACMWLCTYRKQSESIQSSYNSEHSTEEAWLNHKSNNVHLNVNEVHPFMTVPVRWHLHCVPTKMSRLQHFDWIWPEPVETEEVQVKDIWIRKFVIKSRFHFLDLCRKQSHRKEGIWICDLLLLSLICQKSHNLKKKKTNISCPWLETQLLLLIENFLRRLANMISISSCLQLWS